MYSVVLPFLVVSFFGFNQFAWSKPLEATKNSTCRVSYSLKGTLSHLEFRYKEQSAPRSPFYFEQVVSYVPSGDGQALIASVFQLPDGKLNALVPGLRSRNNQEKRAAESEMLNLELLFRLCMTEKELIKRSIENVTLKGMMSEALQSAYELGLKDGSAKVEEMFKLGYVTGVLSAIEAMNNHLSSPLGLGNVLSSRPAEFPRAARVRFHSREGAYTRKDRDLERGLIPKSGLGSDNGPESKKTSGQNQ